jgi:ribonuclease D
MSAFTSIENAAELEALVSRWLEEANPIALDTEFMRSNTYFPVLALVQINDGNNTYLLDPLQEELLSLLKPLFASADVPKVLHACSEDLQVLSQALGLKLKNVFDTQVAAAYCGRGFAISYQKLVAALCDVQLPKDATRSDWLQRPLSDKQLDYAAQDVAYLLPMYEQLNAKLLKEQRCSWVLEDCSLLEAQAQAEVDPKETWQKFKRAWQLSPRQLWVLKKLSAWRESTAIERNRPRSWIAKDGALMQLAQMKKADAGAMKSIEDLQPSQIKRYQRKWLTFIEQSFELTAEELPRRPDEPPGKAMAGLGKQLKACVSSTAERLEIAPEMLARKKDLEQLLISVQKGKPELPSSLSGWRAQELGEQLLMIAEQADG